MAKTLDYSRSSRTDESLTLASLAVAFILLQMPWGYHELVRIVLSNAGKPKYPIGNLLDMIFAVIPSIGACMLSLPSFLFWPKARVSRSTMVAVICGTVGVSIIILVLALWIYYDLFEYRIPWTPINI